MKPAPFSLSEYEREHQLPPAKGAFQVLLTSKTNVRFLSKEERLQLKAHILELAQKYDKRINDVLDHYGINRMVYYYHIEPLDEEESAPVKPVRNMNTLPVTSLPPAVQLEILRKVEASRFEGGGKDLCVACDEHGISARQYHSINRRKTALEKRAAIASNVHIQEPQEGPISVDDPEQHEVAFDAATVLSTSTRQHLRQVSHLLGISHEDLQAWREQSRFEPLWQRHGRKKLPLSPAERKLGMQERMRFVNALGYLETSIKANRQQIIATLGFKPDTISTWTKITRTLEGAMNNGQKRAEELSDHDIQEIERKTGMTMRQLQTWISALENTHPAEEEGTGLTWTQNAGKRIQKLDASTMFKQISLPPDIAKGANLSAENLLKLWQRVWEGSPSSHDVNELVRYYEPIADRAALRRLQKETDYIGLDVLQSYALSALPDAIRDYTPEKGGHFFKFAMACARNGIIAGLREEGSITDDMRSGWKYLQRAQKKWKEINGNDEEPTTEDLAGMLQIKPSELREVIFANKIAYPLSLHDENPAHENPLTLLMRTSDKTVEIPGKETEQEPAESIEILFSRLEDPHRTLMMNMYLDDQPMEEVAHEIGVSEADGWIIHNKAIRMCKSILLSQNGHGDKLSKQATRLAAMNGHTKNILDPVVSSIESMSQTAPGLISRVSSWIAYATQTVSEQELIRDLQDIEYARSLIGSRLLKMPEDINPTKFLRAVRLVLESRAESKKKLSK